jgi:hypothetical protein
MTTDIDGLCYLGRPWNDLATTVFLRTYTYGSGPDDPAGGIHSVLDRTPENLNTTFYAGYDTYGTRSSLRTKSISNVLLSMPRKITFVHVQNFGASLDSDRDNTGLTLFRKDDRPLLLFRRVYATPTAFYILLDIGWRQ